MRKRWIVVLVIALVGAAGWGQSTLGTGQWLHDLWKEFQILDAGTTMTQTENGKAWEYFGFVTGAAQGIQASGLLQLGETTWGQWAAVVGGYLDAIPEQWNHNAEILVYAALSQAWPVATKPQQ